MGHMPKVGGSAVKLEKEREPDGGLGSRAEEDIWELIAISRRAGKFKLEEKASRVLPRILIPLLCCLLSFFFTSVFGIKSRREKRQEWVPV